MNVPKLQNLILEELVSKEVFELLGERTWLLLDIPFIIDVDNFISDLKADLNCGACTINTWKFGGRFNQSGYREAASTVGSKGSTHRVGGADDLKFAHLDVVAAHEYLVKHQHRYPNIRRAEDPTVTKTWLHLDNKKGFGDKLYTFKP